MSNIQKNECVLSNGQKFELPEMEGYKDVFLSYKRENVEYVVRLYKELKSHYIEPWLDLRELPEFVGEEYRNKIRKGIDSSKYFLLIYTKDVEKSDFIINDEVGYAKQQKKKILFYPKDPVDLNTSRLKDFIADIQWMDTEATAIHQADVQEALKDKRKQEELSELISVRREFSLYEDQSLFLIRIALQRILGKTIVFGNYEKLCGVESNIFYSSENVSMKVLNKALYIEPSDDFRKILEKEKFYRKDKVDEVEELLKQINPDREELMLQLISFLEIHKKSYPLKVLYDRVGIYLKNDKYKQASLPEYKDFSLKGFIDIVADMAACSFIADIAKGRLMFNGAELGVYSISDSRTVNKENPVLDMELYYSDYFTFRCMTEMYHVLCSIDDRPFFISGQSDIRRVSPFLCSLGLGGFVVTKTQKESSLMWTKRSGNISSGDMWHFSYDETVSILKDAVTDSGNKIVVEDGNLVQIDYNKIILRALKEEVGATGADIVDQEYGLYEVGIIKSERLEVELISHATIYLSDERSYQEQIMEMHDASSDGYMEISKIEFLPLRDANALVGRLLSPESYATYVQMKKRIKDYVGRKAVIGNNTIVEAGSYIDEGAQVGDYCKIHRNVYVGKGVKIGNYCKIQNNNSIYPGVTLDYGVFVGTNVTFINDRYPWAVHEDGKPVNDWKLEETHVGWGASIGAGAVIMCGVNIGPRAMIGAGAVVLTDVPAGAVAVGNPAKIIKENSKN